MKIPNLFILGFPKTGTTSLHAFLSEATEVYSLPVKEIGNTDTIRSFTDPASEVRSQYLSLFSSAGSEKYIIDASPLYALAPGCGKSIFSLNPDAKIVLGLREPFSYIRSMCNQIERNLGQQRLLSQDIQKPENYTIFNYLETVQDLYAYFSKENVYIYIYDDLVANAVGIQADLCAFLDLAIPNSNRMPMLNKAHRPVTGKQKAFYNYLLQGRAPKAARALLKKSFHITSLSWLQKLLVSVLQAPVKHDPFLTDQLVSEFKSSHKQHLMILSGLLERDLVKLWGYQELR